MAPPPRKNSLLRHWLSYVVNLLAKRHLELDVAVNLSCSEVCRVNLSLTLRESYNPTLEIHAIFGPTSFYTLYPAQSVPNAFFSKHIFFRSPLLYFKIDKPSDAINLMSSVELRYNTHNVSPYESSHLPSRVRRTSFICFVNLHFFLCLESYKQNAQNKGLPMYKNYICYGSYWQTDADSLSEKKKTVW